MRCKLLKTWNATNTSQQELQSILLEPAEILRNGGLVAFPTETVYGLGANAFNEQAVRGVFAAKGRPADNPLIVHIAQKADIARVAVDGFQPNAAMRRAMDVFWPGPLTIILPVHPDIAKSVHPNMDTVGVRIPDQPIARMLIQLSDCPIAAPSANRSGRPSPTTGFDVIEDMAGRIDGVVDGGVCLIGLESTVIAIDESEAVIYRPGGITKEQLELALSIPVSLDPHLTSHHSDQFAPKSPGMKYRHYAPNASVHVWWGDINKVAYEMRSFYDSLSGADQATTAVMVPQYLRAQFSIPKTRMWTAMETKKYALCLSQALYYQLRAFDRLGMTHILICGVNPNDGIGLALMNRLQKSSEGRVLHV